MTVDASLVFACIGGMALVVDRLNDRAKNRSRLAETTITVTHQAATIADLQTQVEYWRSRCERLTDAALARRGEIHEPTMVSEKPKPPSIVAQVVGALGIAEIDSSIRAGQKGPVYGETAVHG